jgi:hypothetical protein
VRLKGTGRNHDIENGFMLRISPLLLSVLSTCAVALAISTSGQVQNRPVGSNNAGDGSPAPKARPARASTNLVSSASTGAPTADSGNPFLRQQVDEAQRTFLDYQYFSTNAVAKSSTATVESHPGGATGRGARHEVHFKSNLKDPDAVVVILPSGRALRGRVLALAVRDLGGNEALLGELKNCEGMLVTDAAAQVLYTDAFDGVRADVLFAHNFDSLEQDIVLREQLVLPPDIDAATARLEVWTEFFDAPEPTRHASRVVIREARLAGNPANEILADDERLDFGTMRMVAGRAFGAGRAGHADPSSPSAVAVVKRWEKLQDGRAFLVESVDYLSLQPLLQRGRHTGRGGSRDRGELLSDELQR